MPGFTKYAQKAILDSAVGLNRDLYVGLYKFSSAVAGYEPYDDGTEIAGLDELTGLGGYARIIIANGDWTTVTLGGAGAGVVGTGGGTPPPSSTSWTGGGPTFKKSTKTCAFTATADWGALVAFGLWDALTAGNLIVAGPLTNASGTPIAVTVNNGETFQFDSSNPIQVQLGDLGDTWTG